LKLDCNETLSNFALNYNLRLCTKAERAPSPEASEALAALAACASEFSVLQGQLAAGEAALDAAAADSDAFKAGGLHLSTFQLNLSRLCP